MGFLRKLGGIFGGGVATNESTRAGSLSRSRPTLPRTRPRPESEDDELADALATMDEAQAVDILADLDEEEQQLVRGRWIPTPQSSNVKAFRWLANDEAMEIEFKDGSFYRYDPINKQEALSMLRAGSKGGWVWDDLRIRGTALGHRKNYVYLSGPSGDNRKWHQAGPAAAAEHGREADRQSANPSAYAFGKGGFGRKGRRK